MMGVESVDKIFEETFVSPFQKNTREDANKVLDDIRSCHSKEHGWKEIKGYVEELPNGKFRAVRHHEKIV
jgi:hypothetical protein